MFYKPTYCCHCGEKIDRAKWKITDSRRFCQSCESEFTLKEWIPRAVVFIGILGALFGFGALLTGKTEKPLSVVSHTQTPGSATRNQKSRQLSPNANVLNSAPPMNTAANNAALLQQQQQAQRQNSSDPNRAENLRLQTSTKSADKQNAAPQAVYFCGAQTKKGTPCSRRVKGGGRCWQHTGQAAMLPPEKLLISQ